LVRGRRSNQLRFDLCEFAGYYNFQTFHEKQISHRNAPYIVGETEEHNCRAPSQAKFSVEWLGFLVCAGRDIARTAPIKKKKITNI